MFKTISKGKRKLIKAVSIYLAIMLFFTFFSKSIYYYITPKVYCQAMRSGSLEKSYYIVLNKTENKGEWQATLDSFAYQYFQVGQSYKFEVETKSNDTAVSQQGKYDFEITKISNDDLFTYITFVQDINMQNDLVVEDVMISRMITVSSNPYNYIVPKSAVIAESFVYFATNQKGYFGEQQVIYQISVDILDKNTKEYAISLRGYIEGEVVIGWDREINDRDTVIVLK